MRALRCVRGLLTAAVSAMTGTVPAVFTRANVRGAPLKIAPTSYVIPSFGGSKVIQLVSRSALCLSHLPSQGP